MVPNFTEPVEAPYPISQEDEMRIYNRNREWFKDAHAQGVNIWYNETFGGDDVCEIKIMKVIVNRGFSNSSSLQN